MNYIYSYVNKSKNNKTYIGSRTKAGVIPEEDFNIKYFSSSKNKEFWDDLNAGQLDGQILLEVSDPEECIRLENILIKAYWEQYGKENSYNLHYSIGNTHQFSTNNIHKVPWNKGLKNCYNEKTLELMRKPKSEECKKNMRKPKSEEGKKNMRKPKSEEGKKNIRKAAIKRSESKSFRINVSIGTKAAMQNIEIRRKISESNSKKYKWLTLDGTIINMDIRHAHRYHPDWKIIEQ